LRQPIEIATTVGKEERTWLIDCRQRMTKALETHAWDGRWWRRGFDDGTPVGSTACESGRIFLNPQSWAVMSGLGAPDRNRSAMDEVARQLDCGTCKVWAWQEMAPFSPQPGP
jgi:cellobiose phosphorylase